MNASKCKPEYAPWGDDMEEAFLRQRAVTAAMTHHTNTRWASCDAEEDKFFRSQPEQRVQALGVHAIC